nr:tail fiber assembly protein [Photorhabdus heterorhabditis]
MVRLSRQSNYEIHCANTITLFQYAVDVELASEGDQTPLLEWKKYVVFLGWIDVSLTTNINWPQVPE